MFVVSLTDIILVSVVSAAGILADAFIVAVNLMDWFKGGRLSTCDQILVCLGVSSACFQATVACQAYILSIWKDVQNFIYPLLLLNLWSCFYSYWLTACLCVFYCVKIVDFNHRLFIWLKLKIPKVVPWLLLGSLVGSLVLSIPVYWSSPTDLCVSQTPNTGNATVPCSDSALALLYIVLFHALGFCLPLLVAMASITLILVSLGRHTRRMTANMSEFSQPRLEAHHRAARMVGLLLLIFCPLFLAGFLRFIKLPSVWFQEVLRYFLTCSSPAQSILVILGNAKLKQRLLKVLTLCRK